MLLTRGGLLLLSALAHGVVYAALPADGGPASWPLVEVDMVVEEPLEPLPPDPARTEPLPEPEPERTPAVSPTPRTRRAEPPPSGAPEPAPPEPAPLADLTGTTLTSPGAGWQIDPGNGERRAGPVGPGRSARPAAPAPAPPGDGGGAGLRLVGAGDLSRPPSAPSLDAILMRHYPSDARRAGLAGSAVVRVRILADGRVASVRVLSASEPAFGAACRATLSESPRWSAPLDRNGAAVATEIRYRCRFEVE
jgi:TonB family protein